MFPFNSLKHALNRIQYVNSTSLFICLRDRNQCSESGSLISNFEFVQSRDSMNPLIHRFSGYNSTDKLIKVVLVCIYSAPELVCKSSVASYSVV
jgi:hypothetical protein